MILPIFKKTARLCVVITTILGTSSCDVGFNLSALRAEAAAVLVKIEDVVVRLQGNDDDHYVTADFELEVAPSGNADAIVAAKPRLREGILSAIADRSLNELSGSSGVRHAKEVVQGVVDRIVGHGQINKIYVTQFVLY